MSSSYVSFSTPALRRVTHADSTIGTAYTTILTPPTLPSRRIIVIIQNKSTTANIEVVFDDTATAGILVAPLGSLSLDNYNGTVRVRATSPSTLIHLAHASV